PIGLRKYILNQLLKDFLFLMLELQVPTPFLIPIIVHWLFQAEKIVLIGLLKVLVFSLGLGFFPALFEHPTHHFSEPPLLPSHRCSFFWLPNKRPFFLWWFFLKHFLLLMLY